MVTSDGGWSLSAHAYEDLVAVVARLQVTGSWVPRSIHLPPVRAPRRSVRFRSEAGHSAFQDLRWLPQGRLGELIRLLLWSAQTASRSRKRPTSPRGTAGCASPSPTNPTPDSQTPNMLPQACLRHCRGAPVLPCDSQPLADRAQT